MLQIKLLDPAGIRVGLGHQEVWKRLDIYVLMITENDMGFQSILRVLQLLSLIKYFYLSQILCCQKLTPLCTVNMH